MILLTDIDQCLLDYASSLHLFMEHRGVIAHDHINNVYDAGEVFGIKLYEVWDDYEFSSEFGSMNAFRDAVSGIQWFQNNGWEIVCISAANPDPEILNSRRTNIKNIFGHDLNVIHTGGDKSTY